MVVPGVMMAVVATITVENVVEVVSRTKLRPHQTI